MEPGPQNLARSNTEIRKISIIQGAPKKMQHSDLYLISLLEVGFYFFIYVLESAFQARFIWTPKQCPF